MKLSKDILKLLNRSPQKKAAMQKERLIKLAKEQKKPVQINEPANSSKISETIIRGEDS